MFSVQFCVCFLMILYVGQCHFSCNIHKNCTKKDNLVIKNEDEEKIIKKNDTTEEYHANSSHISVGIDRRSENVIPKTIIVTEEVSKDNIEEGTEKIMVTKNDNVSGIDVKLYNLSITENKQTVTEKMDIAFNYSDKRSDYKNKSEIIKDTGELPVTIKAIVVRQSTKIINESLTETMTKMFENNTDQNDQTYDLPKNVENSEIHKNVKNETMTDNVNNLLQNNSSDQNVQKYDLPKNVENSDTHTNFKNETATVNVNVTFQNNSIDQNIQDYGLPKNFENNVLHWNVKNETMLENVTKLLKNNSMHKTVQKYDLPKNENNDMHKNVQKRDISLPENISNDKTPKLYQENDVTKYQKYNSHEKYEKHDMAKKTQNKHTIKKIQHHDKHLPNINDDKLHNYENYEMNYKKIIDKNDLKTKKHTRKFDDSHHILPQIQTRLDNDLVKKSLDEFKMVRRKTHYTMPPIDFKNDISIRDIDHYQDLVHYHDHNDKARINGARIHADSDYHNEDIANVYPTYDVRNYQSYEEPKMPNYKELNNLLERQKEIVKQLAQIQRDGNQVDVFEDLMEEVKAKQEEYKTWKNYTKFSFDNPTTKTTTIQTTTMKPTTILTVFDETEIRRALKNDPQVKRILKLANLKRKKYLDNVRNYLVRNNYVHDKGYAKNVNRAEAV